MTTTMKIKPITFLLSLTFLFLFSGSVYGDAVKKEFDPNLFTYNEEVISPKCIINLIPNMAGDGAMDEIKLPDANDCNYRLKGKGAVSVEDDYVSYTDDEQWVSYKHFFGNGIHILNISEGGGGSGVFNTAIVVTATLKKDGSKSSLILKKIGTLNGGDRCNGSIVDIINSKGNLTIKRKFHSKGLLSYVIKYAPTDIKISNLKGGFNSGAGGMCDGYALESITVDQSENVVEQNLVRLDINRLVHFDPSGSKKINVECMMNNLPNKGQLKKEEIPSYLYAISQKCFPHTYSPFPPWYRDSNK